MLLLYLFLCFSLGLATAGPAPRRVSEHVDCIPGDLNIILSAPHGGYNEPSSIPDRDAGCFIDGECVWTHDCGTKDYDECDASTSQDVNTQELALTVRDELYEIYGAYPPTVINLLHRVKFDANRELDEATFGVPEVVDAWFAYNQCINDSKTSISATAEEGMGIFFDIHGHGHPNVWAELGYLISGSNLDNDNFVSEDTSIRNLADYTQGNYDFDTLLRGDVSFGYYLEQEGYEAVPSPTNPGPDGDDYFSGGYLTKRHGSRTFGTIDAIQIESARDHRDDYLVYGYHMALAMQNYWTEHYPAMQ